MTQRGFHTTVKIMATLGVFAQSYFYATTQPGFMDSFNGVVAALVFCSIWLCKESR